MGWLPDGFEHPQRVDCVYIDPPGDASPAGSDALVSWWVVDDAVGSDLERALELLPRWLAGTWGFAAVHWSP